MENSENNKKEYKKVGRPSTITKYAVSKLIEGFKNGFTTQQACLYAGIDRQAYYRALKDNDFNTKIQSAKIYPTLKLKRVVLNKGLEGDENSAKWWLERKNSDEFGAKEKKEIINTHIIGYINAKELKESPERFIEGEIVEE